MPHLLSPPDTLMKTSESKSSNAKLTETENGNTTPPPTPGPAHSNHTTESFRNQIDDPSKNGLMFTPEQSVKSTPRWRLIAVKKIVKFKFIFK